MNHLPLLLKALSDENRFKMVNLLLAQPYCVGALANQLGISEAAVSQHLQLLRKVGLVKGEKRGYWTHYIVEKDLLISLGENLKNIVLHPLESEKENPMERREQAMCNCNCEQLSKGKLRECRPKQIKECHSDE